MDPFIGEIRMIAFQFAPKGWAWCDGQLMQIMQNSALFSILGTTYGGNGRDTFALPNLKGRAPVHFGEITVGEYTYWYDTGESSGAETTPLRFREIPTHTHALCAQNESGGEVATPAGNTLNHAVSGNLYNNAANQPVVAMSGSAIAPAGGDQPHNNMQPYLTLNFVIALIGIYPPRD